VPCWNVKLGYSSVLTLELGDPYLEVNEKILQLKDRPPRRAVKVHGARHLWIYCCGWSIRLQGRTIATSASSARTIRTAAYYLDGQALTRASVDAARGRSIFDFDLGGSLSTRLYDQQSEQWMLFEPSGRVLTVRADGNYTYQPRPTPPDQDRWIPLAEA
jgi:hypothetical protein